MTTTDETTKPSSLPKVWRIVGVVTALLVAIAGVSLLAAGSRSLYGDEGQAGLGAILTLTSPLHLLVPFTIARALEIGERIEASLSRGAKLG